MKTMKQIAAVIAVVALTCISFHLSKKNVKEIRASFQDSTHQGYRSMVADYIF